MAEAVTVGEYEVFIPPLIRGLSRGLSSEIFLKLDCLRVDFQAIFKPVSVILQTDFIPCPVE